MKMVAGRLRTSPVLIRWSGLATMLGVALCILEFGFIDILGSMLWILPPLFAVGVVGLYAGYAERLRRSGTFIALAAGVLSVAGFIGAAAFDGVNDALTYAGWLVFLLGIVILFANLVLFGVANIGARMSRRWKVVPLVVGVLPVVYLGGILLYKALSGWWVTDENLGTCSGRTQGRRLPERSRMSGVTMPCAERREMPSVNLGHWGELAAALTGVLWVVTGIVYLLNPEYWDFASSFDYLNVTVEGAAQLLMLGGLAGLHAHHAGSYERLVAAGFYVAFVGTALWAFGNLGGIPDFGIVGLANTVYIPGVQLMSAGLILVGVATLRASTLP